MATKSLVEVDPTTNVVKNGVKIPTSQLSDATTLGKSLVTAASATAARSAIGALDKPTGKTGQLVYNATTNTWEAAPAGGGAESSMVTYNGSWPTRPSVTGSVMWVDPTGAASMPLGMLAGDSLLAGDPSDLSTGSINELLTAAERRWGIPWQASGAASITVGSQAKITASGGSLAFPDLPVAPGDEFTFSVNSDQDLTLSWETWGGGAQTGNSWGGGKSLAITIPANSETLTLHIEYGSASATMTSVSLARV